MAKTVLITGGARGLGESIAQEFAKHGYDVAITYLNSKEEAQNLVENIKTEYNVDARSFHLDVCDENSIDKLFKEITTLDCLINNAAYNNDCDIFEKTRKEFQKIMNTNVIGPFLMCQKAYRLLKVSKGSIVNIASTNGIDTMYQESLDYDASKAALINLTKNLATAFAPNVRVNAIAPGWIETPATEDMNLEFRGQELSKIALSRFASPDEVAKSVYFVGSEEATYMTGSIIRIDGGKK